MDPSAGILLYNSLSLGPKTVVQSSYTTGALSVVEEIDVQIGETRGDRKK